MLYEKKFLSPEFLLVQIPSIFKKTWKKFLIAAVIGAVIGLGNWRWNTGFITNVALLNNSKTSELRSLNIAEWKSLQRGLAPLAAKILSSGSYPEHDGSFYRSLTSDAWWDQNLTPIFALSKTEAKEFSGAGKSIESPMVTLLRIDLRVNGASEEISKINAALAVKFIRAGGAYIALKKIFNQYSYQLTSTDENIQGKINHTKMLAMHQEKFLDHLEGLHKRYPKDGPYSVRGDNFSEEVVKFLPLQSQIIAANIRLFNLRSELLHLQNIQSRELIYRKMVLKRIKSILDNDYDGLSSIEKMLLLESELRTASREVDFTQIQFLDQLHENLIDIRYSFTDGLEEIVDPFSSKPSAIRYMISGIALVLLFTVFLFLFKIFLSNMRKEVVSIR